MEEFEGGGFVFVDVDGEIVSDIGCGLYGVV